MGAPPRHGHSIGGKMSRTYYSWSSMRGRCQQPNSTSYPRYGGRGIKVCARWQIFDNFLEDMGERPAGTSLDRIDLEGDYTPENCRWATGDEQARNKSNTRWFDHNGEKLCMKDYAKVLGISYAALSKRVEAGWPVERMTEAAGERSTTRKYLTYDGREWTIANLAEHLGVPKACLITRLKRGWPAERWAEPATKHRPRRR